MFSHELRPNKTEIIEREILVADWDDPNYEMKCGEHWGYFKRVSFVDLFADIYLLTDTRHIACVWDHSKFEAR
jgi:hypothetical protein